MKKYLFPIALAIPLLLAACSGREDGFASEEQKERVWSAYKCDAYGNINAASERMDILMGIIGDRYHMDEVPEAQRWERRLERANTVSDAMEYKDIDGISDMCSGWLWDKYTESDHYSKGYEEFTLEQAQEANIVEN